MYIIMRALDDTYPDPELNQEMVVTHQVCNIALLYGRVADSSRSFVRVLREWATSPSVWTNVSIIAPPGRIGSLRNPDEGNTPRADQAIRANRMA